MFQNIIAALNYISTSEDGSLLNKEHLLITPEIPQKSLEISNLHIIKIKKEIKDRFEENDIQTLQLILKEYTNEKELREDLKLQKYNPTEKNLIISLFEELSSEILV